MKIKTILLASTYVIASCVAACAQPGQPAAIVQQPVTKGQCAKWLESGQNYVYSEACGGSSTPAGNTGDIQYNNAGALGARVPEGNGTKVQMFTGADPATNDCAKFDANHNLVTAGAACGAGGSVSVTAASPNIVINPTPGVGTFTVGATTPIDSSQTGTTASLNTAYAGGLTVLGNASPVALTVPQAGSAGYEAGKSWGIINNGAGLVTATTTTSVFKGAGGASTLPIPANTSCWLNSNGTDWVAESCTAYGSPRNIAKGTAALGTSAIGSAACASAVTVSATGVATTDVITAGFNGDPTAVTGYVPLVAGMLTIIPYPTANNVNFKVCNNTNGSITPGAITVNWSVNR